jgi:2-phosphoglycerate kinase
MSNPEDKTRIVLIGGSSHAGKSTLGRSLATKLGWNYRSTDKLARHPGRPWANNQAQSIPAHVTNHYKSLSVDALLLDVLFHYKKNVLPQIEAIVHAHLSNLSGDCLVLEGSALYPQLIKHLVEEKSVLGIWLNVSDRLLQNRI